MNVLSKAVAFAGHKGLYALARLLTRRQPKILMYHHFAKHGDAVCTSVASFRRQLEYISRHFRAVTVSQLVKEYYELGRVPANTIALSIDDGYVDFYETAFPLLKAFNIPATFYVTTGFINGSEWLWTDQLHWMFETLGEKGPAVELAGFSLPPAAHDSRSWSQRSYALNGYLLTLENNKKWEIISQLESKWCLTIPKTAPGMYAACNLQQLQEMQDFGIEIGGHTVSHPSLGRVSVNESDREITECMRFLSSHLGEKTRSFCYPNGTPIDYNNSIKAQVKRVNFSAAVTAFSDSQVFNDRYAIRRFAAGNELFQFYKAISGVEWLGHCVRKTCRKCEVV